MNKKEDKLQKLIDSMTDEQKKELINNILEDKKDVKKYDEYHWFNNLVKKSNQ